MENETDLTPPKENSDSAIFQVQPFKKMLGAALQILGQFLIAWVLYGTLATIWSIDPVTRGNDQLLITIQEIVKLIMVTISVFIMTKIFAKRSLTALGLRQDRWAVLDFAAGLAISFLMSAALFLALLGLGAIKINSFAWQTSDPASIIRNLLLAFLIFAFVGWNEELLWRGYRLQTIASGSNQFWGVFLSSVIFVCLHGFRNGLDFEYIIFLFAMSIFACYAYLKTGQLWLAIGLHAGWSFFIVVIFFGTPINDLNFFRLMDIQVLYSTQTLSTVLELLIILAASRLIQKYALYRNKQIIAYNQRATETA